VLSRAAPCPLLGSFAPVKSHAYFLFFSFTTFVALGGLLRSLSLSRLSVSLSPPISLFCPFLERLPLRVLPPQRSTEVSMIFWRGWYLFDPTCPFSPVRDDMTRFVGPCSSGLTSNCYSLIRAHLILLIFLICPLPSLPPNLS